MKPFLGKATPSPDRCLFSLGKVCQILQCTPGQVGVLMEATEIPYSTFIDDVPYLDGDALQAIVNAYNAITKEIDEAIAKTENSANN